MAPDRLLLSCAALASRFCRLGLRFFARCRSPNLNTIGYQGRHSIHLSYRLRLSRPVHLLDNHSPLAVSREPSLTCSISSQNDAETSLTEPLPRTLRQPLHFWPRSCPRTRRPEVDTAKLSAIESAPHTSRQASSSACHIAYTACSQCVCACRLLNVCLRRLSIGSESHLTVA